MNIEAKQVIRLTIKGEEFELSETEAMKLKFQLERIFPKPDAIVYQYPYLYPFPTGTTADRIDCAFETTCATGSVHGELS